MPTELNINSPNNQININTAENKVVVVDANLPNSIEVTQPITNVVEVYTGPIGPRGEFPTSGSFNLTGSIDVSGSISSDYFYGGVFDGSFTGSFYGTASWAENAVTSSYILNAVSASYATQAVSSSYALNSTSASYSNNSTSASYASTASYAPAYLPLTGGTINGDVIINGTASIALLNVIYESASVIYSSGSNQFGDASNDTQTLYGTVNIKTGPLMVTGSILVSGSHISTVNYIDFITSDGYPHQEGRIHWTDDTKTIQIDTDVNNFMIEVGHQNVVRVRNITGGILAKGKVVYINGESGNRPTVTTASWEGDPTSASTLGWIAQDISDNQTGYVITSGMLRNINTNAFSPGTQLYLSSSGNYTSTVPISPKHEVRLGKVITQATAGTIYVDIMNGYELGELHDVLISSASNGDLIAWDSGSRVWKNTKTLSGSYNVSGSLTATSFTGSLFGTSSWAANALTSSYTQIAQTASYILNAVSSSFASTASYYGGSVISASYALTASYALNAGGASIDTSSFVNTSSFNNFTSSYYQNSASFSSSIASLTNATSSYILASQTSSMSIATASYILNAVSSSFASTASYYGGSVISASYALTASFVILAQTASYVQNAQTASYVLNAISASYIATASWANNAVTASYITLAQTASYVTLAQTASYITTAQTASFVATASWANNAITASYVTGSIHTSANPALSASYALTASYALNGGGGGTITVADESITQGTAAYFNFTGAGVTATVSSNTASISIPGGGGTSDTTAIEAQFWFLI